MGQGTVQDGGPRRAGVGPVIGVGLALMLVLSALQLLLQPGPEELDGEARLAESFAFETLPLDMPVALALRLPGGEEVVQLGDSVSLESDAEERAARAQEAAGKDEKGKRGGKGKGWGDSQPDPIWKTLGEGERARPFEVTFTWFPEKRAPEALRRLFGRSSFGDIGKLGEDGGQVLIEGGTVPWGKFDVPYRRIRHFQRIDGEPTFVDVLRANLTWNREPCALFLRWPSGAAGSKDDLAEILSGLAPAS